MMGFLKSESDGIAEVVDETFLAIKQRAMLAQSTLIRLTEERLARASSEPVVFRHSWRADIGQRLLAALPERYDRFDFQRECRSIQRRLGMPEPHIVPFQADGEEVAPYFEPILDAVFKRSLRRKAEWERQFRDGRMRTLWPARWALDEQIDRLRNKGTISLEHLRRFSREPDVAIGFRYLLSPRIQRDILRIAENRFEESGVERVALIRPSEIPEVPPVLTDDALFLLRELRFEMLCRLEPASTPSTRRRSA